jgi:hypothetical protein
MSTFVLYHTDTNKLYRSGYVSHKGAKLGQTVAAKKGTVNLEIASYEHWLTLKALTTKMVTRVNLMTGQEFQEPEGTPGYMSPASEAYWSM